MGIMLKAEETTFGNADADPERDQELEGILSTAGEQIYERVPVSDATEEPRDYENEVPAFQRAATSAQFRPLVVRQDRRIRSEHCARTALPKRRGVRVKTYEI